MSEDGLQKGVGWPGELRKELGSARFGIVIVTPENSGSQWLHFEAGALAVAFEDNRVVPFLIGTTTADLDGPLRLFNAVTSPTREEVFRLVCSLNGALETPLETGPLDRAFERLWPELERDLAPILEAANASKGSDPAPAEKERDDRLLTRLDSLERQVAAQRVQGLRMPSGHDVARLSNAINATLKRANWPMGVNVAIDGERIRVEFTGPLPEPVVREVESHIDALGVNAEMLVPVDRDPSLSQAEDRSIATATGRRHFLTAG